MTYLIVDFSALENERQAATSAAFRVASAVGFGQNPADPNDFEILHRFIDAAAAAVIQITNQIPATSEAVHPSANFDNAAAGSQLSAKDFSRFAFFISQQVLEPWNKNIRGNNLTQMADIAAASVSSTGLPGLIRAFDELRLFHDNKFPPRPGVGNHDFESGTPKWGVEVLDRLRRLLEKAGA